MSDLRSEFKVRKPHEETVFLYLLSNPEMSFSQKSKGGDGVWATVRESTFETGELPLYLYKFCFLSSWRKNAQLNTVNTVWSQ